MAVSGYCFSSPAHPPSLLILQLRKNIGAVAFYAVLPRVSDVSVERRALLCAIHPSWFVHKIFDPQAVRLMGLFCPANTGRQLAILDVFGPACLPTYTHLNLSDTAQRHIEVIQSLHAKVHDVMHTHTHAHTQADDTVTPSLSFGIEPVKVFLKAFRVQISNSVSLIEVL